MRKKLLGLIAALFAATLLFGTVEVSAKVTEKNGAKVYTAEDPDNMLGLAADFGIFANTVTFNGDAETNVACKRLVKFGDMKTTTNGYFYCREFGDGNQIGTSNLYQTFLTVAEDIKVYVGSGYKLERIKNGDAWRISKGSFSKEINRTGAKTLEFINEDASTPFIDMDAEFAALRNTAAQLAALPTENASYDDHKQSERVLEVKGEQGVINLSYAELSKYDTQLYIRGLKDGGSLIINISGIPSTVKEIRTPQIYINGRSAEESAKYTAQILWNFDSYDGKITVERLFGGTILAPNAFVNLSGGNLVGSVIADSFANGAEVHFVPYKIKKIDVPSEVTVSVWAVDGTCCPAERSLSFSAVLYKQKANGKYSKVGKAKTSAQDGVLSWTIDEAGSYYIKETTVQNGFVNTQMKCVFTVEKDKQGVLRIYPKKKALESNGESEKYTVNADNTGLEFKLRHYSDSLYLAAFATENGEIALHSSEYTFTIGKLGEESIEVKDRAQGLAEDYDMYEVHVTPGQYEVKMYLGEECVETKYVDVYLAPVGSFFFVEKDYQEIADLYESYLGNKLVMTKITKKNRDFMRTLAAENPAEFAMMTDGCLFFNVDDNSGADIIVYDAENADIIA